MFEYVQERESRARLEPRTMAYVVTTGETYPDDIDRLTERGENQILELARSRVVPGVRTIYSCSSKAAHRTCEILGKEFDSDTAKKECLTTVRIPDLKTRYEEAIETLVKMWNDETHSEKNGESLLEARKRFGDCMGEIVTKHVNDSFAVVADPMIVALFDSLVTGSPIQPGLWIDMGHAACATYEYARGWSVVMPPDNSYLSDPTYVSESLPEHHF